jgi:hypothetical protein
VSVKAVEANPTVEFRGEVGKERECRGRQKERRLQLRPPCWVCMQVPSGGLVEVNRLLAGRDLVTNMGEKRQNAKKRTKTKLGIRLSSRRLGVGTAGKCSKDA